MQFLTFEHDATLILSGERDCLSLQHLPMLSRIALTALTQKKQWSLYLAPICANIVGRTVYAICVWLCLKTGISISEIKNSFCVY